MAPLQLVASSLLGEHSQHLRPFLLHHLPQLVILDPEGNYILP